MQNSFTIYEGKKIGKSDAKKLLKIDNIWNIRNPEEIFDKYRFLSSSKLVPKYNSFDAKAHAFCVFS